MNAEENLFIYWQTLSDIINNYKFSANEFISNVQFNKDIIIMKQLNISWQSFEIQHKILKADIKYRNIKLINFMQAQQIRKIMMKKFIILLYAKDNLNAYNQIEVGGI